ncbi:MAG: glycosyltransferase family 87 protein [Candidatus Zixiibacteriota bacterium]
MGRVSIVMSSIRNGILDLIAKPIRQSICFIGRNPSLVVFTVAVFAATFAYYYATWKTIPAFVSAIDDSKYLFGDFIDRYYPMGKVLFVTKVPVSGFFYSAFFAVVMTVFGAFSFQTAVWLWGLLQGIAVLLLCLIPAYFLWRESGLKLSYFSYIVLFVTSLPVLHNLNWGQVSSLITLCILGALFSYRRNHRLVAGFLLGLATSIKLYPAIFILYFVMKKEKPVIVSFLASTIILLVLIPAVLIGPGESIRFHRLVYENITSVSFSIRHIVNSQFFPHVIVRLFNFDSHEIWYQALRSIGFVVFLLNLFCVWVLRKKKISNETYLAFSFLFLSIPFVVTTAWPHYFVYLPFCQVVLVWAILRGGNKSFKRVPFLALLLPSVVLSNVVFFNLLPHWSTYSRHGCLLFSNSLLLAGLYWYVILQSKRQIAETPAAK